MIYVAKDAQKTDGQMDNKNLLLSNDAKMDTKPQLEIYADDVKCSHGCASGQIDENQLFYAQARGIRKPDAMRLITQPFCWNRWKACPIWRDISGWRLRLCASLTKLWLDGFW